MEKPRRRSYLNLCPEPSTGFAGEQLARRLEAGCRAWHPGTGQPPARVSRRVQLPVPGPHLCRRRMDQSGPSRRATPLRPDARAQRERGVCEPVLSWCGCVDGTVCGVGEAGVGPLPGGCTDGNRRPGDWSRIGRQRSRVAGRIADGAGTGDGLVQQPVVVSSSDIGRVDDLRVLVPENAADRHSRVRVVGGEEKAEKVEKVGMD